MSNYFSVHNHSHYSNLRIRDAINKPEDLIEYCFELGLSGVTITDHEVLSAHVKAQQYYEENKERLGDFQVSFGNEIYLVDYNETMELKENNERIPFYHFILIAKNQHGYEGLKKLSSKAWLNSYYYKGLERTPSYKDDLQALMQEYQGDIIATTACLGSEVDQLLIKYYHSQSEEDKKAVHNHIVWLKGLFGEDLYFELQPAADEDQRIANEMLLKVGEAYSVKCIVATDAHYLSKEKANAHKIYLQASEGDREVDSFYATTYVMSQEELAEFFGFGILDELTKNTLEIREKIEPITFAQDTVVPNANIPEEFTVNPLLTPYYEDYEYIKAYANSSHKVDQYFLHELANGMQRRNEKLNDENLSRINLELKELYLTSKRLQQPLSSYFVLTKEVIDIMWEVSLVGVGRGSAACYYVNYLLDIVQINPLHYDLPHWRFLTHERPSLPDIDIDTEGSKREAIMELVKDFYGEENVLNMGTFTTEKTKSTVLTACRGIGIDTNTAHNIANLVPKEKVENWPLSDALYGNAEKGRKPANEFIHEVEQYEGLIDAMLAIENIVSGRSQHASGVLLFSNGYIEQNALMKTTKGLEVTQFDMTDSEAQGGLKLDFLSISALTKIRTAMDMLLEHGKIQWQGTLRETYNKYFHPDVLEMEASEMYDMLFEGHVLNAFQYESSVKQLAA